MLKSAKGFTLIEFISVLLILAILVIVAVPKYVDLIRQAKISAASIEVAEMKSTLNLAYAKYFIANGKAATGGDLVITQAGLSIGTPFDIGTPPDIWKVTLTNNGKSVTISVNSRGNPPDSDFSATGTWNLPE